jgi:dipeptidyl aminopeptidase/acylaminoacyl peptidase
VQGTFDKDVIPSDSEWAISLMKKDGKHEIHMVDGAGHEFKENHLEEFINVSLAFLKKYLN